MPRLKGALKRRDQIIKATIDCIVTHGYHNFSMQDVATTAGVSKGIIHYYFLNKDELMMAILVKSATDIETMLIESVSTAADPMQKLRAFIEVSFKVLQTKKEYYQVNIDFWTQINQNKAVREIIAKHYEKFRSAAAGVIADGIKQGVFAEVDPHVYASYVISVVDGFSLQCLFDSSIFNYEQITASATELILNGLKKKGD